MKTRRDFLKISALASAGLLFSKRRAFAQSPFQPWPASPILAKYVDPVPFPSVLQPQGTVTVGAKAVPFYEIAATQFAQQLHRDLAPTPVWGYGDSQKPHGEYPGPTIIAHQGQPIQVKYRNLLPDKHILPVDFSLMGASDMAGAPNPEARMVTHLHGGHVPPNSDGNPEAWISPEGPNQLRGPHYAVDPSQTENYNYPNDHRSALLWYHDHALGATRLNTYAGMAGLYLLRDAAEEALIASGRLPSGPEEIPLVLQDKIFNPDGSMWYPSQYDPADLAAGFLEQDLPSPSCVPEFFGDTVLVNGKIWPFLEVEPKQYRIRFLNASPARFYRLKLYRSDANGNIGSAPVAGPAFVQIGTESGFLNNPVVFNNPLNPNAPKLMLAPAERADLLIDFSLHRGQTFLLRNDAPAPFPAGVVDAATQPILLIRVKNTTPVRPKPLPQLPFSPKLKQHDAVVTRHLTLNEDFDSFGRLIQRLGTLAGPMGYMDPITETPKRGDTEIWRIINTTCDAHPIHVHMTDFQILSRREFDMATFIATKKLVYTGPAMQPDSNEMGFKETAKVYPGSKTDLATGDQITGSITDIIVRFDAPVEWAYPQGRYMWHCHILEHEEHDMMRQFYLRP